MTLEEESKAKARAKRKKWRDTHQEQIKAYRKAHRAKYNAYRKKWREEKKMELKDKQEPTPRRARNIFALYYGDEFLDIGDKYELAEKFGLSPDSVTWLGTPSGKKSFYAHGAKGYTVVNLTKIEGIDL